MHGQGHAAPFCFRPGHFLLAVNPRRAFLAPRDSLLVNADQEHSAGGRRGYKDADGGRRNQEKFLDAFIIDLQGQSIARNTAW